MTQPRTAAARRLNGATLLLAVLILVPACYGFAKKFWELLTLVGDEEGDFAIMPVANYLLAGVGFLLLFFWAILHGMFRDIERPKVDMLANERRLDAEEEALAQHKEWE